MNPNELKSAEGWFNRTYFHSGQYTTARFSVFDIKQIQLNTYKAGMTEAAELIEPEIVETKQETISRVLSARDRKIL